MSTPRSRRLGIINPLYEDRACDIKVEGELGLADLKDARGSLLQKRDLRPGDDAKDRQRVLARWLSRPQAEYFRAVTAIEIVDWANAFGQRGVTRRLLSKQRAQPGDTARCFGELEGTARTPHETAHRAEWTPVRTERVKLLEFEAT